MGALHHSGDPPNEKDPARVGSAEPGRGLWNNCETDNSTDPAEAQGRPKLDHDKIDALLASATFLTRRLDPCRCHRHHLLESRDVRGIVASRVDWKIIRDGDHVQQWGTLAWIDVRRGVDGLGVVALLAHVLGIDRNEAAYRAALFYTLTFHGKPGVDSYVLKGASDV